MPPRPRGLSEVDQALWTKYATHVAPLRKRVPKKPLDPAVAQPNEPAAALPAGPAPAQAAPRPRAAPRLRARSFEVDPPSDVNRPLKQSDLERDSVNLRLLRSRTLASALSVGTQPGGIDKATWQRFQSGRLPTLRTLDLHGMTANRAFHALSQFLRTAHADQVRCVEVVTGRGSGETGGVIRREFPHWLNLPEIRPLILGAAHPHVLNHGSVRLILRRIR